MSIKNVVLREEYIVWSLGKEMLLGTCTAVTTRAITVLTMTSLS